MARYQVFLDSPLGERRGILMLQENGGEIRGTLSMLGADNPVTGRQEDGAIFLYHSLRTHVSALECRTELHLEGGTLQGTIHVGRILMKLRGMETEEGTQHVMKKEQRNHVTADRA